MSESWSPTVRRLLAVAAVVVTLEAAAVIALAVADLASIDGGRIAIGVGVAVFFLLYGGMQLVAAVLLLRGRAGARGPIVATQLLQLLIAWSLRDVDADVLVIRHLPLGAGLAAILVLVCVLAPPVNRAIAEREATDGV
ncbi:MAG: hypothetical protein P1U38_04160 [Aeromicrobium sp.]|uniref:hypothetical protein n=1 Tax=Aeromicrobium sp. TaxID=1871063 RepID=UPI002616B3E8|nr:hypothetical protein [Aeromicrobium sp.]MDF1703944.1 hypothetical protein [Aeromicrobium sp.]